MLNNCSFLYNMTRFCSALTSAATFKIVKSKVTKIIIKMKSRSMTKLKKLWHVMSMVSIYTDLQLQKLHWTSRKRFCILCNKPRKCPDISKKTLLSFAIKALLLLAKNGEEGAVTNALRKDNMTKRNAEIKWGVTYHIQAARSKVQINASFPFKLKLK